MTRTLDALVAEKVMGWTWVDYQGAALIVPPDYATTVYNSWLMRARPKTKDSVITLGWDFMLPPYSTDIAAAWVAEAKMGEDGAMMELYTDALIDIVSNETASIYNSAIECDSWGNNDGHTVAYKLAHATAEQRCIAMLRAVGVAQDEIDAAMENGR